MKKRDKFWILVNCKNWMLQIPTYQIKEDKHGHYQRLNTYTEQYFGVNELEQIELWWYSWNNDLKKYMLFGAESEDDKDVTNTYQCYRENIKTFSEMSEAKLHCIIEGIECFSNKKSKDAIRVDKGLTFAEFKEKYERVF